MSPALPAVNAERLPDVDLHVADLQAPPFPDASFDVVTAVNALQFVADPRVAIAEASRVLRRDGRLGIGLFAAPERVESTAIQLAMAALSPAREAEHAPYALSEGDNLRTALEAAGLTPTDSGEVVCVWAYAGVEDKVRGLMGSGGARARSRRWAATRSGQRSRAPSSRSPIPRRAGSRCANVFRWLIDHKESAQEEAA